MIKRMVWITSSLVVFITVSLLVAGEYFYNVAVSRSHDAVDLYGGSDGKVEAASAMVEEEKQAKLEEIMKWTERQSFETAEIESEDGIRLKAVFLKNENSNGKAVVLAHGYKGNHTQMPGITKYYYELGYDVLKPDARGHGDSGGDYIGYGWDDRIDYQRWVRYLIDEKQEETIFLHGFSMGAATVLMTSGEELPPEVKGIIEDSGYTSVEEELAHQLKYLYHLPSFPLMQVTSAVTKVRAGYSFGEASALEQVKKNKLPLFVIHGDQDELVPTEMASRIYEVAGGIKEMWIVPGAGHTEAYTIAEEEYQKRLGKFLEKAKLAK
ncbi:alpha/beta hydrolase [Pseudalkalibacillus caeni]|uniref:Alpha/beta hydrolase n=1 Tax=Exobacillus caeni TaxID=2574798 RepID=A0A5R9F347_9BACL|nr:alpha/beta hydrolase [Pseudalkalibacillus caeni]TLS35998.1 alpha/beta hydrolase [Pseudalkalibacillus caeni]